MPNARFQLTEPDIVAAARHARVIAVASNPLSSWVGRAVSVVGAVALVHAGLGWLDPSGSVDHAVFDIFAVGVITGFASLLVYPEFSLGGARRRFRRYPMARAPVDIAWDATGIAVNPYRAEQLAWRGVEKWTAIDGMMLIYVRARVYFVLPSRAFAEGEREEMQGYLERAGVPEAGASWWRRPVGLPRMPGLAKVR